MKLFYSAMLLAFTVLASHAMAQDDQGLPNPGGNEAAPVEAAPAQSTKEFNSDIDDFEKKVDKEVPGANKGKEPSDRAAAKAKQQIKDQMTKGDPDNGGKAKSAVPTRSAKAAAAASAKKKPSKKASAAAKKKGSAAKKKAAAKKKKKK